ncbi:hypothetical protein Fmac_032955 [Flemingia macrophylla]|uniref:Gibberellin regulated protein n=1 Tax=Flemingia macrophylla TaxID=520843 RepID=A0ABD1L6E8_9FABA
MAFSKVLLASVLISMLIGNLVESDRVVNLSFLLIYYRFFIFYRLYIDCDAECDRRCHLSSRPNLCKRACGTCCDRCSCVPSGTYDHYEECPCYENMTTHDGRHKCP